MSIIVGRYTACLEKCFFLLVLLASLCLFALCVNEYLIHTNFKTIPSFFCSWLFFFKSKSITLSHNFALFYHCFIESIIKNSPYFNSFFNVAIRICQSPFSHFHLERFKILKIHSIPLENKKIYSTLKLLFYNVKMTYLGLD